MFKQFNRLWSNRRNLFAIPLTLGPSLLGLRPKRTLVASTFIWNHLLGWPSFLLLFGRFMSTHGPAAQGQRCVGSGLSRLCTLDFDQIPNDIDPVWLKVPYYFWAQKTINPGVCVEHWTNFTKEDEGVVSYQRVAGGGWKVLNLFEEKKKWKVWQTTTTHKQNGKETVTETDQVLPVHKVFFISLSLSLCLLNTSTSQALALVDKTSRLVSLQVSGRKAPVTEDGHRRNDINSLLLRPRHVALFTPGR